MKTEIKLMAKPSALGGDATMFLLTLDPQNTWTHGIMENSRYSRFYYDPCEGKIEQFAHSGVSKFRKRKCTDKEHAKNLILEFAKQQ